MSTKARNWTLSWASDLLQMCALWDGVHVATRSIPSRERGSMRLQDRRNQIGHSVRQKAGAGGYSAEYFCRRQQQTWRGRRQQVRDVQSVLLPHRVTSWASLPRGPARRIDHRFVWHRDRSWNYHKPGSGNLCVLLADSLSASVLFGMAVRRFNSSLRLRRRLRSERGLRVGYIRRQKHRRKNTFGDVVVFGYMTLNLILDSIEMIA
jgi:hypothetical protein